LWPFGSLGRALDLSWENLRIPVETPPLLADLLLGTTMFAYLRRSGRSLKVAWAGMLFVALNPALLFDTVVWGQTDSIVTSLMWLATLVALDSEYVMAAAVLAIAVLVKPHALIVIPLLACWVLRKDGITRLWAPVGAFAATVVVAVTPFAVGRPWDWLPRFYAEDLTSFPETSVNAFNLMAIVGGLRQPETAAFYGVSDFTLGLALALAVLALSCGRVWRNPSSISLMLSVFLALFGEFLFAPRMHERYLYPALVFFAPLALEGLFWFFTFVLLSLNWLFNLVYVLHALETTFWLDKRPAPAMLSGVLNLLLFGAVLSRITTLERDASSSETQRPTPPIPTSSRLKLCCNAVEIWGRFSRLACKIALSCSARVRRLGLSADERALVAMVLIVKASLFIFVGLAYQIVNSQPLATAWAYLEIWNRWDGPHYLDIAQRGYQASGADRVLLVFYPLYPWTIRAFATVFRNTLVSALAVSTVASLAAAVELYWLAVLDHSPRLARVAVWFLFIFPTSYCLHTDYSESLFLALILGAFLAARDDHWMTAGTLGMLAGLAHPNGALLFPALGAEALSRFWRQRRFKIRWLWIGLIPLAPLIYLMINYFVTGDPRAFMGIEREHWFHFVVPPWRGIAENLNVALTYGPYEAQ
jgi:Gpi18-like mannosyltransferase